MLFVCSSTIYMVLEWINVAMATLLQTRWNCIQMNHDLICKTKKQCSPIRAGFIKLNNYSKYVNETFLLFLMKKRGKCTGMSGEG